MNITPLTVARNRAARLSTPTPSLVRLAFTTTTGDAPRGPSRAERADKARMEAISEQVYQIMRPHQDADACCPECDMSPYEIERVDALWDEWEALRARWND